MSVSGYSLMHTIASFALPRQRGVALKIMLIRVYVPGLKKYFNNYGISESVVVA